MFTGLIETLGVVRAAGAGFLEIGFTAKSLELDIGESVSVDGVCLSVIARNKEWFRAEVSKETLVRSTLQRKRPGAMVNLERALRLGGRLGGHIVQGHVDGVGRVMNLAAGLNQMLVWVEPPKRLMAYIAEKGSIAVDGVSLTVAELGTNEECFAVAVLPLTREHTTLQSVKAGGSVNLEVDVLAKYAERLLDAKRGKVAVKETISLDLLQEHGFF